MTTTTDTATTTTDTATTLGVLTADDLAALKLADSVSFHHSTPDNGGPVIRLHLVGGYSDVPRIFTAKEQRVFPMSGILGDRDRYREIAVESSAYGYGADGRSGFRSDDRPRLACFEMIHSAQVSDTWGTIVRLLKSGDRLTLSWIADNNTDNVRNSGLHNDELRLFVCRAGQQKPYVFHVASSVCPDNSARMIKENGY